MTLIFGGHARGEKRDFKRRLSALQQDPSRLHHDLSGLAEVALKVPLRGLARLSMPHPNARAAGVRAADQIGGWTIDNLGPVREQVKSRPGPQSC